MRKFLLLLLLSVTLPVMAQSLVLPASDLLTPITEDKPTEDSVVMTQIPESDRQQAHAAIPPELADAQWGEWYEYDKGTFYSAFAYPRFFDSYALPITLDRRDDLGGSGYSQIRFNKLFGDVDFIAYLDNNTKRMSWEEMELPYTHEDSEYDGHYFHLMAVSGMEWSLKRDMYLNFWFCIKPNYGYNFSSCFYRSSHVITDWNFSVEWLDVTNDMKCYNNTQSEAILKYTPDPRVKRTQFLWYNSADYSSTDLSSIRKYNPEAATISEGEYELPFFDGAGIYDLIMAFFDEDNDLLLTTGTFVRSNLFSADEWEEVGVGKFDPVFFDFYRSGAYENVMCYSPDIAGFAPYDVKIIRRKDNPAIIRVVNPFNTGTPFENIDISYGIANGYSSVLDQHYDNETIVEVSFYHDEDYYIEIDTREDEYGDGSINDYIFPGFYSMNISGGFGGRVVMKDGVIRDKSGAEFILTLPDYEAKELAVGEVIGEDTRDIIDIFFAEKYTQKTTPSVKIEVPMDVYRVYAAILCAQDYDPESTPKDIVAGKVPDTQKKYTNVYNYPIICYFDFDYPEPLQSGAQARAADKNSYKIVFVATTSSGAIKHVATVDHSRSEDPDENVKIGTVTFVDPVSQLYNRGQEITADIYEYKDRPGLFRIDTPWEKSLYPKYPNAFTTKLDTPTDLIIDATDPEKVEIIYGCVGYGHPLNEIYMWHALTYGTYYYIKTEGRVISLDPENYGQYVRSGQEETITFPQMVCASTANCDDTNFSQVFGYYPTVFTITRAPGSVNEVIVDETDAAPVYYNLQGQPVANPANGIYIVRRGTKVTKEYVR